MAEEEILWSRGEVRGMGAECTRESRVGMGGGQGLVIGLIGIERGSRD